VLHEQYSVGSDGNQFKVQLLYIVEPRLSGLVGT